MTGTSSWIMLGLLILPGLDEQATDTINSTTMAREICNRLIFRFIISCEMDGKPLCTWPTFRFEWRFTGTVHCVERSQNQVVLEKHVEWNKYNRLGQSGQVALMGKRSCGRLSRAGTVVQYVAQIELEGV